MDDRADRLSGDLRWGDLLSDVPGVRPRIAPAMNPSSAAMNAASMHAAAAEAAAMKTASTAAEAATSAAARIRIIGDESRSEQNKCR